MIQIENAPDVYTAEELAAAERALWMAVATGIDTGEVVPADVWMEQGNIVLTRRQSKMTGPVDLSRTPYMRGIFRAYSSKRFRRIVLVWGAQTGKTLVLQGTIGHCVDQEPGPTLVVYPSKGCLLYTSPSPRDRTRTRMPSSA